jgi:nucleoside-diphosphate-sugar epimerase
MLVLVTGATGKVGQEFLCQFGADSRWANARLRALCHNRGVDETDRVEVVRGSISDRDVVDKAMDGVTHVLHLATVKESPDLVMDVSVKGMFWLLEAFRQSTTAKQFLLVGGDCSVGHIFHGYDAPITEDSPRRAYPGCYALSKVIEEVMLEQYYIQYGIDGCCLRAPWIMDKDDFRYALSFGDDQFGGPSWADLVADEKLEEWRKKDTVPLMIDRNGAPLRRNFVHVSDLVRAILAAIDNPRASQQLFNICMNRPLDYGEAAAHLSRTRGFKRAEIRTDFHSNWLDNSKARHLLGWEPEYDFIKLIEEAFAYQRQADEPRKVWYVG